MDKTTYWQKQITSWSQSEQTQKNYCTEHRLSYSQFIYWRNRLKQKTTEPPPDIHSEDILPQWMPITVATAPAVALTLQINTLQLEFSQQVDPTWLGQVIHELSRVEHQ